MSTSRQYDNWRTEAPDDSIRDAAIERDQDRYVQDWIDGNLVEIDGEDRYHGPINRALEADGIDDVAGALEAMRSGKWPQVTLLMARFLTDVEQEIRKDA